MMKTATRLMMVTVMLVVGADVVEAKGFKVTKVRAIHASPDAPTVDVLANGSILFAGAPFGGVTNYVRVKRGTYSIQVVPTGETEPVVIDADLQLSGLRDYTIIAVGRLAQIEPLVLIDRRFPVPRKRASVRFVHASPDAPAVDIAVSGGAVLFSSAEFKDVTPYRRVRRGTYDLEVRLAGTDTVVLEIPDVELKRGVMYTAIATGLVTPAAGEPSLAALLVEDRRALGR